MGSGYDSRHTGAVGPQPPKYALVERERRFLVQRLPPWSPEAERRIIDRYLHGTRLRVRTVEDLGQIEPAPPVFKLTQKVPGADRATGTQGHLTTIYLDEAEHRLLGRLPGVTLTKRRLAYPPMAVDVFEGGLEGLLIAEVEFDSDAAMAWFTVPSWCGPEITGEPGWSGAELAALAAAPPDVARRALAALTAAHAT